LSSIKQVLLDLSLVTESNIEIFSESTRDVIGLKVFRDKHTGVIFIDAYDEDKTIYPDEKDEDTGLSIFEDTLDLQRRLNDYRQFVFNKDILDFGCGKGDFLLKVQSSAKSVRGVEIDKKYLTFLNSKNIPCYESIEDIDNASLDTVFGFHSLEHVGNPIEILSALRKKIVNRGYVIFEVPHANDFLIENLKCIEFIDFTLWSQHLILHTRESLRTFLLEAGYSKITIQAKQRYSVSNHLNWLSNGKPGGHKSDLSLIDTMELKNAYERSLQMINATDTLIAVAQV